MCLVYPIHVSTRLFDVTYLNTEKYDLYCISSTFRSLKREKKKINLPNLPIFRPKRQTNWKNTLMSEKRGRKVKKKEERGRKREIKRKKGKRGEEKERGRRK